MRSSALRIRQEDAVNYEYLEPFAFCRFAEPRAIEPDGSKILDSPRIRLNALGQYNGRPARLAVDLDDELRIPRRQGRRRALEDQITPPHLRQRNLHVADDESQRDF